MNRTEAARHEGKFTVTRMMTGAKVWNAGDKRDGKVADLAHLAETGALVARDKATAEALTAFFGREFQVGEAPTGGSIANGQDGVQDADEIVLDEAGKAAAAELEKDNTKKELVALAEAEEVEISSDDNKGPIAAKIVAARQAKAKAEAGGSDNAEGGGQNKAEAEDAKTK